MGKSFDFKSLSASDLIVDDIRIPSIYDITDDGFSYGVCQSVICDDDGETYWWLSDVVHVDDNENCWDWYEDKERVCVEPDGEICERWGYSMDTVLGVRPVLDVSNLESFDLHEGDNFLVGDVLYQVLDSDAIITVDIIGKSIYNQNLSVDYSDMKLLYDIDFFINDWAMGQGFVTEKIKLLRENCSRYFDNSGLFDSRTLYTVNKAIITHEQSGNDINDINELYESLGYHPDDIDLPVNKEICSIPESINEEVREGIDIVVDDERHNMLGE